MTTTLVALILAAVACVAIVAGSVLVWGIGVALLVGGALGLVAAVLLYDPVGKRP